MSASLRGNDRKLLCFLPIAIDYKKIGVKGLEECVSLPLMIEIIARTQLSRFHDVLDEKVSSPADRRGAGRLVPSDSEH